jgi:hypothetical protein
MTKYKAMRVYDDAVVRLREEIIRGGFGGPAVEDVYLEIGEE